MPDKTTIERADTAATEAAAPIRHSRAIRWLGTLSEVADQPQLISICAATLAAGIVSGRPGLARAGARMLAAELLATQMKSMVKHRIDRTRPHVVDDGGNYEMKPGSDHDSAMNSFPSGHTAGAVAVARAIARDRPGAAAAAAYATAAAIAAIQVPRCKHYPSDLAAGAAIGVAAEALVNLAGRTIARIARRGGSGA